MAAGQTSVMKAVQTQLNVRYPSVELRREPNTMSVTLYCFDCQSTQGITAGLYGGPYAILEEAEDLCANFHGNCQFVPDEERQRAAVELRRALRPRRPATVLNLKPKRAIEM